MLNGNFKNYFVIFLSKLCKKKKMAESENLKKWCSAEIDYIFFRDR